MQAKTLGSPTSFFVVYYKNSLRKEEIHETLAFETNKSEYD